MTHNKFATGSSCSTKTSIKDRFATSPASLWYISKAASKSPNTAAHPWGTTPTSTSMSIPTSLRIQAPSKALPDNSGCSSQPMTAQSSTSMSRTKPGCPTATCRKVSEMLLQIKVTAAVCWACNMFSRIGHSPPGPTGKTARKSSAPLRTMIGTAAARGKRASILSAPALWARASLLTLAPEVPSSLTTPIATTQSWFNRAASRASSVADSTHKAVRVACFHEAIQVATSGAVRVRFAAGPGSAGRFRRLGAGFLGLGAALGAGR
mmetsp:Transcript_1654/g.3865  ORF Transcript_1654/g.3865 Transcript_1654/m.3865 type:complete len:265 (-) Transcript_1654:583-1377(-)